MSYSAKHGRSIMAHLVDTAVAITTFAFTAAYTNSPVLSLLTTTLVLLYGTGCYWYGVSKVVENLRR